MKNRVMLIGSIGAGKSTLTNALLGKDVKAVKTQTLIYRDWIVDTPGEYTENPLFYKNIMATALEVTHVCFIQDATGDKLIFPPGFSSGISKLPIGVVTKADAPDADIGRSVAKLKQAAGNAPIVVTSAWTGQGLGEFKDLVQCSSMEEINDYVKNSSSAHLIYGGNLYN